MRINAQTKASELARGLVRVDTVNPPGSEAEAQRLVSSFLAASGVPVGTYAQDSARPNLVARLPGRGQRPALILHGHVDVVGVDHQVWTHPPFEGEVRDGVLWGRGALDNKAGVAMLAHGFARASRDGLVPSGDVILVSASDSETGGSAGMAFLLQEHPDIFSGAGYAIGEFGGFTLTGFDQRLYAIGVGLKQYAHLHLRLTGKGGHGSRPTSGSVSAELGRVLDRIDSARAPLRLTELSNRVITSIADALGRSADLPLLALTDESTAPTALASLGELRPGFEAMLRDTANPTLVRAGDKFNVIPSEATVELDCRLAPGGRLEDFVDWVRFVVGPGVETTVLASGPQAPARFDESLMPVLESTLRELDPEATPVPYIFSESPDGRLFDAHGIQHYGYLPMPLPPEISLPDLIHGPDERVPMSSIDFGADAIHQVLRRY
jgi:acetylornithine deacetylase/succinyl-diaminopimelate desuccinylase-like protein